MASISHRQFLNIAKEVAQSSNCVSLKVGAVIVVDNRIRTVGYNGTPAGYTNCNEVFTHRCPEHTAWSQDHEVHAELNAILYAAAEGLSIKGGILYSTAEPCKNCLKHMIASQLKGCVFEEAYYNESIEDKETKFEFAQKAGFAILQNINGLTATWYPPVQRSE